MRSAWSGAAGDGGADDRMVRAANTSGYLLFHVGFVMVRRGKIRHKFVEKAARDGLIVTCER